MRMPLIPTQSGLTAPCICLDLDVSKPLPGLPPPSSVNPALCVWILVRVFDEPIGTVVLTIPAEGMDSETLSLGIAQSFGAEIALRMEQVSDSDTGIARFEETRQEVLKHAPPVTIVIPTHERPHRLDACLKSLLLLDYPDYMVLVVDNAATTGETADVVRKINSPIVRYIAEPKQGASRARNLGLRETSTPIVAFIDDDEIADPHWLAELARGFNEHPEAVCVAGAMVPAELETEAQVLFEQFGGFTKHRGFTWNVFSPATARNQSPLYPLPQFGAGGNMAFKTEELRKSGGFDASLGAGSKSMGGEETRAFTDLLLAGGTMVYQPTAITHHFHRRSIEELRRQMYGYGAGLTAFYTSLILTRPKSISGLVGLLPSAYRDFFGSDSLRSGSLPDSFPKQLLKINRKGLVSGPFLYLRARHEARHTDKMAALGTH
jgi:glycosyltransferase involved in cell wall biosynthesis